MVACLLCLGVFATCQETTQVDGPCSSIGHSTPCRHVRAPAYSPIPMPTRGCAAIRSYALENGSRG